MNERYEKGMCGENLASQYISENNLTVICRNFHSRYGEIDIIAQDSKYIVFIEVKTRKLDSLVSPSEAVTKQKQTKIIKTAVSYLMKYPSSLQPRFDVIEVFTGSHIKINHIPNAFSQGTEYSLY